MITTRKNFLAAMAAVMTLPTAAIAQDEVSGPVAATKATVANLEPRTGLPLGWQAPAVELKDRNGDTVKLADLYANGPTVIAFYRGGWCPYCAKQLKDWRDYEAEFESAGVNIVFITPEAVENVNTSIDKTDTPYAVLSDTNQQAAALFNVIFDLETNTISKYKGYGIDLEAWNANQEWQLPVPGVFLIDSEGVLRWQHLDEDYTTRVDPEAILEQVAAL